MEEQMRSVWARASGLDEGAVALGEPLFHQGREAAQEIHPGFLGGLVQGAADAHHAVRAEGRAHHGDGADADALVDHRDAVLVAYFVANGHELRGIAAQLGPHVGGEEIQIVAHAVKQAHAQGDGAHIQMLVAEHVQGADDFAF